MLLVSRERGGDVVICACERAESVGVRPGQSLAHARALAHGLPLHIEPFDAREYADKLQRLARWAERFSPVVAPDHPDGLLLDIAGCEGVFRGADRLVKQLADALRKLGLPARLALGPTVGAAWAVARHGPRAVTLIDADDVQGAVAPLPIAALRICWDARKSLSEVGIERIGDLLRIPRSDLAARFGDEVLRRIDQLTGDVAESVTGQPSEQRFEAVHEFDGPITRIDIIETVMRHLLRALLADMRAADQGIRHLSLSALRVNTAPTGFLLALARPTRDGSHIWNLIAPKVERLHLGYGVEALRLSATQTARVTQEQLGLWAGALNEPSELDAAAMGELLDLLFDRFGRAAVVAMKPVESFVPEQAFIARAPLDAPKIKTQARILDVDRPTRLFAAPEPVRVIALVPDGPPASLHWNGCDHPIRASRGPERLVLPWWSGRGASTSRDYYEAELECGRRLWLFRMATNGEQGPWFVHGEWA